MKKKLQMRNTEAERAFQDLIAIGLIKATGRYRNGQMVYVCTPDAELSDEARAYAAYLDGLKGKVQIN